MNTTMESETLYYTQSKSPIGPILAVVSDAGLVALRLIEDSDPAQMLEELAAQLPGCAVVENAAKMKPLLQKIDMVLQGNLAAAQIPLDLRGTPFQKQVWRELLKVAWGQTRSYSDLAKKAGKPNAVRAVASACARNPVAFIVPCHRILRKGGALGGYYWGLDRKRELLEREKA